MKQDNQMLASLLPPDVGDMLAFSVKLARLASCVHDLQTVVHRANGKWWHDAEGNPIQRNKGELLALVHSEISEALEGERRGLRDQHLPDRKSVEVELADAIIRILDYGGAFGLDIGGAIADKILYNLTRPDHSHEERAKVGGKQF